MENDSKIQQKYRQQAEMLANRVKKRHQHLRKRFARQQVDVFRLYDWDIPEIRAVVDWYGGHLVVGEYTRRQTTADWLPSMAAAVARVLNVDEEKVHLKQRFYGKGETKRYERIDTTDELIVMRERDLKFYVNPNDYVDTGLFSDHRDTRQMVRRQAEGKDFLNLFCYTGAFTCAAARGGARKTVSVDRSKTAITWARKNFQLNDLSASDNLLVQMPVNDYLARAQGKKLRFDLAVVDPPSFYTIESQDQHFDIARDHPALLSAVVALMRKGATIFFSTNHQRFTARLENLPVTDACEITAQTIPEDYFNKRKKIHRCWEIRL